MASTIETALAKLDTLQSVAENKEVRELIAILKPVVKEVKTVEKQLGFQTEAKGE